MSRPSRRIFSLVQGPPEGVPLRTWRDEDKPAVWLAVLVYAFCGVAGLLIGWGIFRGVVALLTAVGM